MIKFQCQACGHKIGISEQHAGKKGKCPKCQITLHVPDVQVSPMTDNASCINNHDSISGSGIIKTLESDQYEQNSNVSSFYDPISANTKTCPFCAEDIPESEHKCKHCGELIMKSLTSQSSQSSVTSNAIEWNPSYRERVPGSGTVLQGYIFAFLLPPLGVVLGINLIINEDFGHGVAVLFLSIVFSVVHTLAGFYYLDKAGYY